MKDNITSALIRHFVWFYICKRAHLFYLLYTIVKQMMMVILLMASRHYSCKS